MGHARALLRALDALPDPQTEKLPGVYLDVQGRPGEDMVTSSLNASDLKLLRFKPGEEEANKPSQATVFASAKGLAKLQKKIVAFETKNRTNRDGSVGRPCNADLAQSIGAIIEAGLKELWRSPDERFPEADGEAPWEIWLDPATADQFIVDAPEMGVAIGADKLKFPEDIVVIATATPHDLALAVRRLAGVRALAAPTTTPEYFDGLPVEEQAKWVDDLLGRTTYEADDASNYITLLDTGVSRAHPLIAPVLSTEDRHAAKLGWSLGDQVGHGTQMAGLALFEPPRDCRRLFGLSHATIASSSICA